MQKYNCIIVEDEPLAADIIKDYIQQVPFLELKEICSDAVYAMEKLRMEKIDLMFLDINLPKIKGMEFLESLESPPAVIITSAYKEYALQGYEFNVVDYLLKPISFSRFLRAVNKLNKRLEHKDSYINEIAIDQKKSFFFNVGKKRVKIDLDDILYIESLREYVRITTTNKSILTKFQLNEIEDLLSKNNFIRIHRSFLVAKNKITAFTSTDVEINNAPVPIGRSYKEFVLSVLQNS